MLESAENKYNAIIMRNSQEHEYLCQNDPTFNPEENINYDAMIEVDEWTRDDEYSQSLDHDWSTHKEVMHQIDIQIRDSAMINE